MQEIKNWLNHFGYGNYALTSLPGDASARRYFRIQDQNISHIVMDASQEKASCTPYVAVADALRNLGLQTPEILLKDLDKGYLVISDFGDDLYLKKLTSKNAQELYLRATQDLLTLQKCEEVPGLQVTQFDAEVMTKELNLFREWFLEKYLKINLTSEDNKVLDQTFGFLAEQCAKQPYVFTHRDYHSANLLVLPNQRVGLLDFQDAFFGPITYDLVSLLRDCYVAWPEKQVLEWVKTFWEELKLRKISLPHFEFWFDMMGVQRHLKALMTFSRKYSRDNNSNYLQHIPRTLKYVLSTTQQYTDTKKLHSFLTQRVMESCAQLS